MNGCGHVGAPGQTKALGPVAIEHDVAPACSGSVSRGQFKVCVVPKGPGCLSMMLDLHAVSSVCFRGICMLGSECRVGVHLFVIKGPQQAVHTEEVHFLAPHPLPFPHIHVWGGHSSHPFSPGPHQQLTPHFTRSTPAVHTCKCRQAGILKGARCGQTHTHRR